MHIKPLRLLKENVHTLTPILDACFKSSSIISTNTDITNLFGEGKHNYYTAYHRGKHD